MDGKHQAVAEAVVETAVVALAHQAGLLHLRAREIALAEHADQRLAGALRVPQAELRDGLRRHAAPRQVRPRRLTRSALQVGAESLLRHFVHLESGAALPRIFVGILRALGQRNAVTFGQLLERLPETEALLLHDELDHVAAGTAGEAFVKLVHHVNREGGRLFVVEGAQSHIAAGPGLAQLHVLAHHVFDAHLRFELIDEVHGGLRVLSRSALPAGDGARADRRSPSPFSGDCLKHCWYN